MQATSGAQGTFFPMRGPSERAKLDGHARSRHATPDAGSKRRDSGLGRSRGRGYGSTQHYPSHHLAVLSQFLPPSSAFGRGLGVGRGARGVNGGSDGDCASGDGDGDGDGDHDHDRGRNSSNGGNAGESGGKAGTRRGRGGGGRGGFGKRGAHGVSTRSQQISGLSQSQLSVPPPPLLPQQQQQQQPQSQSTARAPSSTYFSQPGCTPGDVRRSRHAAGQGRLNAGYHFGHLPPPPPGLRSVVPGTTHGHTFTHASFRHGYFSPMVRYEISHIAPHSDVKDDAFDDHLAENRVSVQNRRNNAFGRTGIPHAVKQRPDREETQFRKPWRSKKYPPKLLKGGDWDQVSRAIWDKYAHSRQRQDSYDKKAQICSRLSMALQPLYPGYMFLVTGSTLNGFGLEKSDLDLCLFVDDSSVTNRDEAVAHLESVKQTLDGDPSVAKRVELIMARVPILKFRDAQWDLEVDINCNSNVAIRNTHLLYCYSISDWRVRPLVTIVKLWAARHNINDAKNMTISSYSLVLMVIHFLQCGVSPPVLPCLGQLYPDIFSWQRHVLEIDVHRPPPGYYHSQNSQPLGELLLDFLDYYAKFDYVRFALSVRLGTKIPIEACHIQQERKNGARQWPLMCIEEPFERTNTAYAVHNREVFNRILAVFHACYTELSETKQLLSIFKPIQSMYDQRCQQD